MVKKTLSAIYGLSVCQNIGRERGREGERDDSTCIILILYEIVQSVRYERATKLMCACGCSSLLLVVRR